MAATTDRHSSTIHGQQVGDDNKQQINPAIDELAQARKEVELLKAADPFNVLELVVELQLERLRTVDAMNARDALVHRLVDAYESLRQKTTILEMLQKEQPESASDILRLLNVAENPQIPRMREEITKLQATIQDLRDEVKFLKGGAGKNVEPPPCYEEGALKAKTDPLTARSQSQPIHMDYHRGLPGSSSEPSSMPRSSSQGAFARILGSSLPQTPKDDAPDYRLLCNPPTSDEPADMVRARNAILASLPLPEEVPEDMLSPLSIPAPFTLQEFISNLSGPLRTSLSHYRLFYALTTLWCPEREEHGYFYTPAFKCNTNPRVTTAHRWSPADVIARMNKPTECFFNKDGTWYYAGIYKAFRLDDLTTKEWAELSTEATQTIVKETIAARKNTSPQNVYEVTQLYAAGALKVACVGLQCVGFNNAMYKALLEQAATFSVSKWKVTIPGAILPGAAVCVGSGASGTGGVGVGMSLTPPWPRVCDVVGGLGAMSLGTGQSVDARGEVLQAPIGDGRGKR